MTDRGSTEGPPLSGVRQRVRDATANRYDDHTLYDGHDCWRCAMVDRENLLALYDAALRDTGPRPDSGGNIDALLAEADRRVTALQYDVKNARMRQGIGMGAGIYRDVIARLSTPRTETSDD